MNQQTRLSELADLAGLPADAFAAFALSWRPRNLAAGEVLRAEDEMSREIGIVAEGALHVVARGRRVGRIGPAEVFDGGAGGLRAVGPTRVLLLGPESLVRMREGRIDLYESLLARAATAASRRLRVSASWLGRVAAPDARVPGKTFRTWLREEWRRLSGDHAVAGAPPPIVAIALRVPALAGRDHATTQRLLGAFRAVRLEEGDVAFREGEHDPAALLLATGSVSLLRRTEAAGRARRLRLLLPGGLAGAASFYLSGLQLETAVAREPGWAYVLTRSALETLEPEARALWHEVALASLRDAAGAVEGVLADSGQAEPDSGAPRPRLASSG